MGDLPPAEAPVLGQDIRLSGRGNTKQGRGRRGYRILAPGGTFLTVGGGLGPARCPFRTMERGGLFRVSTSFPIKYIPIFYRCA